MIAPMVRIGVIRSIPCRIPQLSATHPTSGSAKRPGNAHSDPILNPIDLARGGIASDRAARSPGPTIATEKLIKAANDIAIQSVGDRASPAAIIDARVVLSAKNLIIKAGSFATSFSPTEAPTANPASCAGSTAAAIIPRARSSRLKASS